MHDAGDLARFRSGFAPSPQVGRGGINPAGHVASPCEIMAKLSAVKNDRAKEMKASPLHTNSHTVRNAGK
jgi:hypothetical protein